MSLFADPLMILVVLADLALIVPAVRLALRSKNLRRKRLWVPLAMAWPMLVIIWGSAKFKHKALWAIFTILVPAIAFGSAKLAFSASFWIPALIVVGWWRFAPEPVNAYRRRSA